MSYKRTEEFVLVIEDIWLNTLQVYSLKETTFVRELFEAFLLEFSKLGKLSEAKQAKISLVFNNKAMGSSFRAAKYLEEIIREYSPNKTCNIFPLQKGVPDEN